MVVDEVIGLGGVEPEAQLPPQFHRIPPSLMMAAVAENDADPPPVPSAEIEVNIQKLSDGGLEAESQLPRPFHRTPRSSSVTGMNIQMTAVAGDESEAPPASSPVTGMNSQMTAVAGDEAEAPSEVTTGLNIAGDEPEAPSEVITGLNVAVAGGEEAGRDPPRPLPPVHRVTPSSVEAQVSETGVISERWLSRIQLWASRMSSNAFPISGGGLAPPAAEFSILPEGGDGANGDPHLPPPETGVRFNAFSISGVDGRPTAPANGEPPLPPAVDRFMRFRVYASIPAISGTCIHVLAGMMDPTTENKKLIGVSMMSLIGNVVASTWLIFRGGDLPNADWKNISFKTMFVFTGELTFYASFATLTTNWFNFPGIIVCGVLAVGLGHSDGLTRLCKKFVATIKNATQKIRESIA